MDLKLAWKGRNFFLIEKYVMKNRFSFIDLILLSFINLTFHQIPQKSEVKFRYQRDRFLQFC